ncbi:MAG: hypothetical protein ABI295_10705 [Xanthomarina sp.]
MALSVFALSWITLLEFHIPFDKAVLYFIFFASISGYNFVKYFGRASFHHRSLTKKLKVIQVFSFFCFVPMCYFTWQLEFKTIGVILGFGLITFLYTIPFLPKNIGNHRPENLRNVSGIKVYVIALVWAGVTVGLPIINNNISLSADIVLTVFQRFVFIIALMIPFEIRDLNCDSLKLATIPQQIGVRKTKIIGVLLLVVFFFLEFFKAETNQYQIIALIITSLICLFFIIFANKNQGKYYSAFWAEGIPVYWLFILLLFL